MISFKKQLVLAAATVLLSACGGGGGGSTGTDSKPASNSLNDPQVQASISTAVSNGFNWEVVPAAATVAIQGTAVENLRVNVSRYTEEAQDGQTLTLRGESLGSGMTDAAGKVDLGVLNLPAGSSDMVLVELFDDQRPELGVLASSKVSADKISTLVFQLKV